MNTWRCRLGRTSVRSGGITAVVTLDHAGYPEEQSEHLAQGWHDNYWNNIRATLDS